MSRRDSSPNPFPQPSPNLAPIPSNPTPSSRLDPAAAPFVPVVEPPPFVRRRLRAVYPSSSSSSAPPPQERSIDPDILAFLVGQSTVSQNLMSGHEAKLKGIEDQAVDELCLFLLGGEAGRGEEQNGRWYDGPRVVPRRSIVVFVGDDFGTGKGGQGWHGMECGNSIVREAERKLRDRGYSDVHFMRTPESETRRFCPWPGCTDSGGHQNRLSHPLRSNKTPELRLLECPGAATSSANESSAGVGTGMGEGGGGGGGGRPGGGKGGPHCFHCDAAGAAEIVAEGLSRIEEEQGKFGVGICL